MTQDELNNLGAAVVLVIGAASLATMGYIVVTTRRASKKYLASLV